MTSPAEISRERIPFEASKERFKSAKLNMDSALQSEAVQQLFPDLTIDNLHDKLSTFALKKFLKASQKFETLSEEIHFLTSQNEAVTETADIQGRMESITHALETALIYLTGMRSGIEQTKDSTGSKIRGLIPWLGIRGGGAHKALERAEHSRAHRSFDREEVTTDQAVGVVASRRRLREEHYSQEEDDKDFKANKLRRVHLRREIQDLDEARRVLLEDMMTYKKYLHEGEDMDTNPREEIEAQVTQFTNQEAEAKKELDAINTEIENLKAQINALKAIQDLLKAKNIDNLKIACAKYNTDYSADLQIEEAGDVISVKNLDSSFHSVEKTLSEKEAVCRRSAQNHKEANDKKTAVLKEQATLTAQESYYNKRFDKGVAQIRHIEQVPPARMLYLMKDQKERATMIQQGLQTMENHYASLRKRQEEAIRELEGIDHWHLWARNKIVDVASWTRSGIAEVVGPKIIKPGIKAVWEAGLGAIGSKTAQDFYSGTGKRVGGAIDGVGTAISAVGSVIKSPFTLVKKTLGLVGEGIQGTPNAVAEVGKFGYNTVGRGIANTLVGLGRVGLGTVVDLPGFVLTFGKDPKIRESLPFAPKWGASNENKAAGK